MKNAYIIRIHQTDENLAQHVFECLTTKYERLQRAMEHAIKLDAVFNCYSVPIDDKEWQALETFEKSEYKKVLHWGWSLPGKA